MVGEFRVTPENGPFGCVFRKGVDFSESEQ